MPPMDLAKLVKNPSILNTLDFAFPMVALKLMIKEFAFNAMLVEDSKWVLMDFVKLLTV